VSVWQVFWLHSVLKPAKMGIENSTAKPQELAISAMSLVRQLGCNPTDG
jgi:hypothetical protein